MDKNKSIDGLTSRRAKIATTLSETAAKPVTTKPTKPIKATKVTKSTKTVKTTKSPRPVKTAKTQITTKTTKAPKPVKTAPIQDVVTPHQAPTTTPQPAPKPAKKTPAEINADFLTPVQVFDFDADSNTLSASEEPLESVVNQAETTPGTNLETTDLKATSPETTPDPNNTDPSDPLPTSKSKKPKKAKKPVSKKRKIITTIILVIVLLLIGAVTWLVLWGNDIIAKITGGQGNVFDLLTFVEPTYEPLKTDENGRTNILAFGTSGYNMDGDEGNGTHDGAQLTDSIMVISLNQETGDLAMLSLPRDLKASPTCTATGKINEVYWCNNMDGEHEQEGAEALMTEVSDILGVDFQYYAHLNWGSLIQIVDTLGGINVTLDEGIYDYYYTGAVFEPGVEYTIDGAKALGLARARHGTTGGDFSRGASQQKILIGIKDKIFEKSLSLTDIISLASTLGDNLRTNFSVEEMKTLAHLTSDFDFDAIRQVSLVEPEMLMTTGNINNISYVLPAGGANYYTRIQKYVAKMFSNNPSVYEDATILILNGTETPGLAGTEQKTLEDAGYDNISIDDAPEGTYEGQYTLYALTDEKPGTKKLLEERYSQTAKTLEDLPAGITQDYDFILIIGNSETQE